MVNLHHHNCQMAAALTTLLPETRGTRLRDTTTQPEHPIALAPIVGRGRTRRPVPDVGEDEDCAPSAALLSVRTEESAM